MSNKKVELECDYCGLIIHENDYRCPNCGADCSQKIKKYKAQKEEEKKNITDHVKLEEKIVKTIIYVVFIILLLFGLVIFFTAFSRVSKNEVSKITKNYHSSVKYKEWGEADGYKVKLDSYELYSYVSDKFPDQYNTPEGYQKIAFQFLYENTGGDKQLLSPLDVTLKADGYKVDSAGLSTGSFERVEAGQAKYVSIFGSFVNPSDKIQGYVGYLVPKSAKELVFTFDDVKITMDNPIYQER